MESRTLMITVWVALVSYERREGLTIRNLVSKLNEEQRGLTTTLVI
jgi:hypothetical protein